MGVYDDFVALANELIGTVGDPGSFGMQCVWTQVAVVVDPAKPWNGATETPTDYDVVIFFKPTAASTYRSASGGEGYSDQLLDRETQSSKRIGIMPAQTAFTPNLTDYVTLPTGEVLRPRVFDLIAPNGEGILWSMSFDTGETP